MKILTVASSKKNRFKLTIHKDYYSDKVCFVIKAFNLKAQESIILMETSNLEHAETFIKDAAELNNLTVYNYS